MKKEQMWEDYLLINPRADQYEAWSFGGTTPDMPNILADLVITGQKKATASAYAFYQVENSPLPQVGDYNMILDSDEEAICITKTTRVYTTPFCDVTDAHACKEGEGDKSLDFWIDTHKEFFARELQEIGLTFTPDMLVVCEEFKVVYPVK